MSTRKSTEAQREASRLNGAKSRGPVTAKGRRNSADALTRLPRTQALYSSVLNTEDPEAYEQKVREVSIHLRPETDLELDIVRRIAQCMLRFDRAVTLETAAISIQTGLEPDLTGLTATLFAFRSLIDRQGRFLLFLSQLQRRLRLDLASLYREFSLLRTCYRSSPEESLILSPHPEVIPIVDAIDRGRTLPPSSNPSLPQAS